MKPSLLNVVSIMFFLLVGLAGYSQEVLPYHPPLEQYQNAQTALSEERYNDALGHLALIDPNDSLYLSARALQVVVLIEMERYNRVIEVCDSSIIPSSSYNYQFLQGKGLALLRSEAPEEAIETYRQMLRLYPKSQLAYYNMGVGYENAGQYQKAIDAYKESIQADPYYPYPHLKLGNLCLNEGLTAQAILCYDTYLVLNPTLDDALDILVKMDRILTSKISSEQRDLSISEDDSCFSEIDLILKNYIGLNENYRVDIPLDLNLVKQHHALMASLENFRGNGGFFDRYYVPFYRALMSGGYFESFIYRILTSTTNDEYREIIEKNDKNSEAFIGWVASEWSGLLGTRISESGDTIYSTFLGSGEIELSSVPVKGRPDQRLHTYYHKSGNISATGRYQGDSMIGQWSWWSESGLDDERLFYVNGQPDGPYLTYHDNGKLKKRATLKGNDYQGLYLEYSRYGTLTDSSFYKDDLLQDTSTVYYLYGAPFRKYTIPYSDGTIHGQGVEYHPGGEVKMKVGFEHGSRRGDETHYDTRGTLIERYPYREDLLDGDAALYFRDGTLKESRVYRDDHPVGTWKTFYGDGTLELVTNYNELGELSGEYLEYDRHGKLTWRRSFESGKMKSFFNYNSEGDEISRSECDEAGRLNFRAVNPDGTTRIEGTYDADGEKVGTWNYYNSNGTLVSTEHYEHGKLQGVDTEYYVGGVVESENSYINGSLDGPFKTYHPDGTPSMIGQYVEGVAEGRFYKFFEDGHIREISYYFHDEEQGIVESYSPENKLAARHLRDQGMRLETVCYDSAGAVVDTFHYFEDTQRITRFGNGSVRMTEGYQNGFLHGKTSAFHFNKALAVTGNHFMGNRHGPWEWYNEKGQLTRRGVYEYGDRIGEWMEFHDNGEVSRVRFYRFGKLHGEYISYLETGQVDYKATYVDGEQNGRAWYYSNDGALQMVRVYDYGRVTGYSYPGGDGALVPVIPVEQETADITCYYPNGEISRKYSMVSGKLQGTYLNYYSDGTLFSEDLYSYGNRQGEAVEYHPNGTLKQRSEYLNDELHGPFEEYYPDGSKRQMGSFRNGLPVGTGYHYDKNGNLEKKKEYFNGEVYHEVSH